MAAPEPVAPTRPSLWKMLWRAMFLRCPRCGGKGVLAGWFRMTERCPSCRLRYERESDFFLGAYVINLVITEGLLIVALFVYVFRAVSEPGTPAAPVLVVALAFAVGAPLAFFPFSRTIWTAIDLAMRPVPMEELSVTPGEEPVGEGSAGSRREW